MFKDRITTKTAKTKTVILLKSTLTLLQYGAKVISLLFLLF